MSHLFDTVELGHRALDYHLERHNVLSSNVANADTPGFHPRELVRNEFGGNGSTSLSVSRTQVAHLGVGGLDSHDRFAVAEEQVVNPGNDDNSVSVERELSKIAANHLRYESATQIVRMRLGQLRYAANDGSGA